VKRKRQYIYQYPRIEIEMYDREALEPASRALKTIIIPVHARKMIRPYISSHQTEKECGV